METFAHILKFVLPAFIVLIFLEMLIARVRHKDVVSSMDSVSSLSSGLTNILKQVLGLTVYIISYDILVKYLVVFPIKSTVLQYIIGFISIDFYAYWSHRWRHRYNILWNDHVVHHSSEEYNLPVALRQTISDLVQLYTFLLIPAAVFGIPSEVLTILGVVMLFGGFWYHTQLIGRLGFLEKIIVTPSHHRIHHAINPIYIDKNYGGILIIWDKLFGTFQEELPDVKPVYGITRPVSTWNPIKINFLHITLLAKDAWRTSNYWDKLRIWFMPTGWRPADVALKYPVPYIRDVTQQQKYRPDASIYLKGWAWTQLFITFFLMMFLLFQLANIPKPAVFVYSAFIFFTIYSYTSLMDRSRGAWLLEGLRFLFALVIINNYKGWFNLNDYIPQGTIILGIYFTISLIASIAFDFFEFRRDNPRRRVGLTPATPSVPE